MVNLGYQGFKITNLHGDIDACTQFEYMGVIVSASTIGRSQGGCPHPVAVFENTGDHQYVGDLIGEFHSIEDAIKFIDGDTNILKVS